MSSLCDVIRASKIVRSLEELNLVPRVLWLFGQRVGASRDSGVLEFCYRKISAVKQWKSLQGSQSKNLNFFEFPRVSTGAHPLTKKPEDSEYEIGKNSVNSVIISPEESE